MAQAPKKPSTDSGGARPGAKLNVPQAYLHGTKPAYLEGIKKEGLIAGKSKGIGEPGTGKPFTDSVFVALNSAGYEKPSLESGTHIAVISGKPPPGMDPNYKMGHAGYFFDAVPPLREFDEQKHQAGDPRSFALAFPMTPKTRAGAHRYMKALNSGATISDTQAESAIEHAFDERFANYMPKTSFGKRRGSGDDDSKPSSSGFGPIATPKRPGPTFPSLTAQILNTGPQTVVHGFNPSGSSLPSNTPSTSAPANTPANAPSGLALALAAKKPALSGLSLALGKKQEPPTGGSST